MKRFRFYIDESGDHTFCEIDNPSKRHLGLTGIMIETEYYRTKFHPDFEELKQKYFPHDPDHPLIFHRSDIVNKRGQFKCLLDPEKEERFNQGLLSFLSTQDFRIITLVIDKESHQERYGTAVFHPYHYCLVVLLDRFCGVLHSLGSQGDVMAESRGGFEDMELKHAYQEVWESGTHHREATFFQQVLTSKEVKLQKKQANIAGLQVADLLAHPLKQNILQEARVEGISLGLFGMKVCQAVASKYSRQEKPGDVNSYGRVSIK
jgi:hypothetical protein